jgi:hypothetical protein
MVGILQTTMNEFAEITTEKAGAAKQSGPLFAKVVSYIFHPVFMPFLMTLVLYYTNKPSFITLANMQPFWLGAIALNTIFFPLVATLLMKKLGFIQSIFMEEPKDRIIPLLATMIFYFWAYQVVKVGAAPFELRVLFLGSFYGIIATFMINIFYKVSMHAVAAGGAIGILCVQMINGAINMLMPLLAAIVVAGLVGTARLLLKAHKPFEIWLGYIAGILVQLAAMWYLA